MSKELNKNVFFEDEQREDWKSKEDKIKDLNLVKYRIVRSIIATIPFSIFFYIIDVDKPWLLIYYLKILRLAKIYPLFKVFAFGKTKALNFTRIVEMLFIYYIACHIIACSFI
jgi:hypothetical protein